jgi:hypothetical protein
MTTPKGWVEVEEVLLPIVDVSLVRGAIEVTARRDGPLPESTASDYTVRDPVGLVVYRSRGGEHHRLAWPEVKPGEAVFVTVHLDVTFLASGPAC